MSAKNADEKTNKTGRLKPNIIDFLIVIVVIGAIAGIFMRTGVVEQVVINNSLEKARVTFLIQDINEASGNYFHIGDRFYATTYATDMGPLESAQIMPAEAYISTIDGQMIQTFSNNKRIDVRGTFVVEGRFGDEGFLLSGVNYIAPGSTLHIQSKYIDVNMTVMDIAKVTDTAQ